MTWDYLVVRICLITYFLFCLGNRKEVGIAAAESLGPFNAIYICIYSFILAFTSNYCLL